MQTYGREARTLSSAFLNPELPSTSYVPKYYSHILVEHHRIGIHTSTSSSAPSLVSCLSAPRFSDIVIVRGEGGEAGTHNACFKATQNKRRAYDFWWLFKIQALAKQDTCHVEMKYKLCPQWNIETYNTHQLYNSFNEEIGRNMDEREHLQFSSESTPILPM